MIETCRLLASYENDVRFPSGSTVAISLLAASKTLVTALPSGLILATGLLAASNTVVVVFPSGSIVATALLAASNTVEETNPSAFVVLTACWLRQIRSSCDSQARPRSPPRDSHYHILLCLYSQEGRSAPPPARGVIDRREGVPQRIDACHRAIAMSYIVVDLLLNGSIDAIGRLAESNTVCSYFRADQSTPRAYLPRRNCRRHKAECVRGAHRPARGVKAEVVRFPSGSTLAITREASSNTVVAVFPSGSVRAHQAAGCIVSQAARVPERIDGRHQPVRSVKHIGAGEAQRIRRAHGLLAASYPSDVRLPSGSTDATRRFPTSNTFVEMFPSGSVRLTSRLPASKPKLVVLPSGIHVATTRLAVKDPRIHVPQWIGQADRAIDSRHTRCSCGSPADRRSRSASRRRHKPRSRSPRSGSSARPDCRNYHMKMILYCQVDQPTRSGAAMSQTCWSRRCRSGSSSPSAGSPRYTRKRCGFQAGRCWRSAATGCRRHWSSDCQAGLPGPCGCWPRRRQTKSCSPARQPGRSACWRVVDRRADRP